MASLLLIDIEALPEVKPSFYRECYVDTAANNRHLLLSSKIIENWYERADAISSAELKVGQATSEGTFLIDSDLATEAMSARPIVVLGDVGVGKTSFFENLFLQLGELAEENLLFVHINLGSEAAMSDSLKAHILSRIADEIRKQTGENIRSMGFVRSLYFKEIADFEDSIYGYLKASNPTEYHSKLAEMLESLLHDFSSHVHAALGHLSRGRLYKVLVVLDNADQRNYEIQQEAFLIASEFASYRHSLVFVALRPSTFYTSTRHGALSGYQNRVFTIASPPAEDVILKRLSFAGRVAGGQIAPEAVEKLRLNVKSVVPCS